MEEIKIAFAGFRHAHIFDLYARVKHDSAFTVTAAFENSPEGLEKMREKGIPVTHSHYDTFLKECDADIIAVGDYYAARGEEIIKALSAHKHVIADKPLCTSFTQLEEIKRLSSENSLSVMLMLDLRYHASFIKARELIRSGEIGEIKNIQFNGAHDIDLKNRPHWYFEEGKHGGTINDLAVHGIDLVYYLTGLDFAYAVSAFTANAYAEPYPDFKDSAAFIYTLKNGAIVTGDTSYCSPALPEFTIPQYWRFNVWGTKGALEFSEASDEVRLIKPHAAQTLTFSGKNASFDALNDLVNEINGKPGILDTDSTFKAAEIALELQMLADK